MVSGVDLSQPLAREVIQEIHSAWLQHHVLFSAIRIYRLLLKHALPVTLASLISTVYAAVDESAFVIPIIKEADATMNFGGDWHTDTSYKAYPPKATLLYAVEVPQRGGDTLFADDSCLQHSVRRCARRLRAGKVFTHRS